MNTTPETADQVGALRSLFTDLERLKTQSLAPAASLIQMHVTALTNSKSTDLPRFQTLAQTIGSAQARIRNTVSASADTFIVQGLIVDETNKPRADCSLVVADAGQVISSHIGPQKANADGYATVLLRAQEFPTIVNGETPIFISVTDDAGRQVFAPSQAVQAKSGVVATFRAVVPRASATSTP